jgi:hypothetical protein
MAPENNFTKAIEENGRKSFLETSLAIKHLVNDFLLS